MWQAVVASALVRIGLGSMGSPGSSVGSAGVLGSRQSISGFTCFNFLPFSWMGSAHLQQENKNKSEATGDSWRRFDVLDNSSPSSPGMVS